MINICFFKRGNQIHSITFLILFSAEVFSQTPGQQFCFCRFDAPAGNTRLGLGILYNFDVHSSNPKIGYVSLNAIQDISINNHFGLFISGGINCSGGRGNEDFKLKEISDQFRGLNLSFAGYYLWKFSYNSGAYFYPQITGKSNTLNDKYNQNIIQFYQLSLAFNAEFMFKKIAFIPYPVTIGARLTESKFSSYKYKIITGNDANHLESLELSIGLNYFTFQLAGFGITFSPLYTKQQSPYYRVAATLFVPRMDLVFTLLNDLF